MSKGGPRLSGGDLSGVTLHTVKGMKVRPALARVRNSLFNIIAARVPESRVLDMFAGTGSVGLEALSRGAAKCVFVENDPECAEVIRLNVDKLRCDDRAEVMFANAFTVVPGLRMAGLVFDLVFVDPPYRFFDEPGTRAKMLELFEQTATSGIAHEETLVVVEHRRGQIAELAGYDRTDRRDYGDTQLSMFRPCKGCDRADAGSPGGIEEGGMPRTRNS
jgi:16S rRNA (guanine966-N2)-methyltransferase